MAMAIQVIMATAIQVITVIRPDTIMVRGIIMGAVISQDILIAVITRRAHTSRLAFVTLDIVLCGTTTKPNSDDLCLQPRSGAALRGGCFSRIASPALSPARISVSSSLLKGYDESEILNPPNLSHER
jgi:hypothetical protein